MAVEVRKFITEQLQTLPVDHPDREHLGQLLLRTDMYLARQTGEKSIFTSAASKLQFLIELDGKNTKNRPKEENNQELSKKITLMRERYGEESAYDLIPLGTSYSTIIFNIFRTNKINTKKELIQTTDDKFLTIRAIGEEKLLWLTTIRDLAKEQLNQQTYMQY